MAAPDAHRQPCSGANFLVSIGDQDGHDADAGFAEVVFPPFQRATSEPALLVLRRGVTGRRDLYEWWDQARRDDPPPTRVVTVRLLADDRRTVVTTWRFLRAYPVTLAYSPLNAMDGGVVMEQIALAFERVEMT